MLYFSFGFTAQIRTLDGIRSINNLSGFLDILTVYANGADVYLPESYDFFDKYHDINVSFQNESRRINHRLERLDRKLKTFVTITGFDSKGFERQSHKFCQLLNNITSRIENLPHHFIPSLKFKNVKHVFLCMKQAVRELKKYDGDDLTLHLVRCVIQLNIMLFALQDSFGLPNHNIQDFSKIVSHLTSVLYSWGELFKRLTDVPSDLHGLFYAQFFQADNTLFTLANYTPY